MGGPTQWLDWWSSQKVETIVSILMKGDCWCRNAYPEVARTARVLASTLKRMGPEQAVNIDAAVQVRAAQAEWASPPKVAGLSTICLTSLAECC